MEGASLFHSNAGGKDELEQQDANRARMASRSMERAVHLTRRRARAAQGKRQAWCARRAVALWHRLGLGQCGQQLLQEAQEEQLSLQLDGCKPVCLHSSCWLDVFLHEFLQDFRQAIERRIQGNCFLRSLLHKSLVGGNLFGWGASPAPASQGILRSASAISDWSGRQPTKRTPTTRQLSAFQGGKRHQAEATLTGKTKRIKDSKSAPESALSSSQERSRESLSSWEHLESTPEHPDNFWEHFWRFPCSGSLPSQQTINKRDMWEWFGQFFFKFLDLKYYVDGQGFCNTWRHCWAVASDCVCGVGMGGHA